MRHWKILLVAAAAVAVACGGRTALDSPAPDAGGIELFEGDASCKECHTNEDCRVCAPMQEGAACCDIGSGTCFVTMAATCPEFPDGGPD